MRKEYPILITVLLIIGLFGSSAWAGELSEKIKKRPVNVLEYTYEGIDYGLTVLMQLLKTGKPTVMWNKENQNGSSGFGLTLMEGFLHKRVNLVGGARFVNNKPRYVFWGLEIQMPGKLLERFPLGFYWSQDEWWFGVSLTLRKMSI